MHLHNSAKLISENGNWNRNQRESENISNERVNRVISKEQEAIQLQIEYREKEKAHIPFDPKSMNAIERIQDPGE